MDCVCGNRHENCKCCVSSDEIDELYNIIYPFLDQLGLTDPPLDVPNHKVYIVYAEFAFVSHVMNAKVGYFHHDIDKLNANIVKIRVIANRLLNECTSSTHGDLSTCTQDPILRSILMRIFERGISYSIPSAVRFIHEHILKNDIDILHYVNRANSTPDPHNLIAYYDWTRKESVCVAIILADYMIKKGIYSGIIGRQPGAVQRFKKYNACIDSVIAILSLHKTSIKMLKYRDVLKIVAKSIHDQRLYHCMRVVPGDPDYVYSDYVEIIQCDRIDNILMNTIMVYCFVLMAVLISVVIMY